MKLFDENFHKIRLNENESIRYCKNCKTHTKWKKKPQYKHSFCLFCRQGRKNAIRMKLPISSKESNIKNCEVK